MVDKNIFVNNPTLKGVADSKTQQRDDVNNDDQHELFQQVLLHIDCHYVKSVCIRSFSGPNAGKYGPEKLRIRTLFKQGNTPENAVLSNSSENVQESLSESITDLKEEL